MALITPKTFVTSDPLPASDLNTYVSGILDSLMNPPSAKAYSVASQSIPTGTNTLVTFDSESWDNNSMHSTSTNTSRITVPVAGVYLCSWYVRFAASATLAYRIVQVMKNGVVQDESSLGHSATTTIAEGSGCQQLKCAANDYIEIRAFQNTGSALSLDAATNPPSLAVTWNGFG